MGGGLGVGAFLRGFDQVEMGLHVSEVGTCGESGHKRSVGRKGVETDPGVDRRASPGGVDHPDGNVFAPVDLAGEKVGDGREVLRRCRGARLPAAGETGERRIRGLVLHAQQADLGQVGLGDLLVGVGYMRARREIRQAAFPCSIARKQTTRRPPAGQNG